MRSFRVNKQFLAPLFIVTLFCTVGFAFFPNANNTGQKTATDHSLLPNNSLLSNNRAVEQIKLPAATVFGKESAAVYSKASGYVKSIGIVRHKTKGVIDIDIGQYVEQGTVLAVIAVPEMANKITEKKAAVASAKQTVLQADAKIAQAKAVVSVKKSLVIREEAKKAEKAALLKFYEVRFKRIHKLVNQQGAVNRELLEEAEFQRDAAKAAIQSVDAAVKAAKEFVKVAQADVKRAEADKKSVKSQVAVVEAQLAQLVTIAKYSVIRAPFSGTITKRSIDHGVFVRSAAGNSSATPLFEITQTGEVRVVVFAPNTKALQLRVGQTALFHTISGLPGVTVSGTISRTSTVFERSSRMMRIEVDFKNLATNVFVPSKEYPSPPKNVFIRPGMFGTVTVLKK